ncbi:MAG: hypothetical protein ETSY2_44665 [Candidatus Entotheonella gemina]|uniref:Uncharacterized protein n=1 Tax=Candidatus Entotheonella gemina TaxID=1429439 RepID=W4LHP0_9BACT|nr:MAG: hypothetical protein ETSY2_44665 [Candidatus Entotheonella gemina]
MFDGYSVLLWISQNGHTITEIADIIGYTRPRLSQALHQDQITLPLARLLDTHFQLKVIPSASLTLEIEIKHDRPVRPAMKGRSAGSRSDGSSKLDEHLEEIAELVAAGVTQKEIAERYQTTPSNLHDWLKRRGLKAPRSAGQTAVEKSE